MHWFADGTLAKKPAYRPERKNANITLLCRTQILIIQIFFLLFSAFGFSEVLVLPKFLEFRYAVHQAIGRGHG